MVGKGEHRKRLYPDLQGGGQEDFLEEKGSSEALKAAECDIEEGKGGMFGEVVTVWDWVEEGSGWDYRGETF